MKLKKNLLAVGMSAAVLLASVGVSAGTIGSTTLMGTNVQTGDVHLGSGSHTLSATGKSGKGTARVMEIVPYLMDKQKAEVRVTTPHTGTGQFTAQAYNGSGVFQSYYIKWNGQSSTSSAVVKVTH